MKKLEVRHLVSNEETEEDGVDARPHPSPLPQERENVRRPHTLRMLHSVRPFHAPNHRRTATAKINYRNTGSVASPFPLPGGEGQGEGERQTNSEQVTV